MHSSPITRAAPRRATSYLTVASHVALSCLIVGLTATCTVGQDKPVVMTPEIAKKMAEAKARAAAAGQPVPGQPAPGQPAPDGAKPAGDDAKKDDAKKEEGKDGDSGGVKRPDEPAEPADPEELKVRPDDDGKISFIFKGQPWTGVLEWLADISEMSLEWQEVPSGFLNLRTRQRYTVDEVRDLINSVLLSRGYTLLRSGEILMVAKLEGLDVSLVPRVSKDELDDRGTYEIVKTFFDLNRLRAETVAEEFKPLLSPHGKISALKTTNRIEVVETAGNLRRLREMLSDEQGASGQELEIREFPLRYVHAEDALATLETLLGTKKEAGPPMSPQEMQQMQQMRQQQQQQQGGAQPPEKDEPKIQLAVNRRNNSVVAHAPPDQLAVIEKAISYLDVPSNGPASASPIDQIDRIRNYRLTQADPDSVIKVLRDVGGLSPSTQLTIDKNGKSIIASASLVDHYIIEELVKRLNGSERTFHVIELRRLSAEYVAGSIEFLMHGEEKEDNSRRGYFSYRYGSQDDEEDEKGEFQVEADTENNRLLLRANESEKEEIYDLLAKLGEDPRQAGDGPTTRLIRTLSGDETEQLLERLQHAWPSLSPNPLQIQPAPESDDPKDDGTEQHDTPKPEVNDASNEASVSPPVGFGFLLAAIDDPDAQPADAQQGDIPSADAPPPETSSVPPVATAAAPPVSITRGPEGLVITCQDPAALEAFFDLAEQLSPRKQGYHTFRLEHTYAREVAYLLEDIFDEDEEEEQRWSPYIWYDSYGSSSDDKGRGRLSDRRPLKFVPDPVTNTILVLNADTKQLAEIESLIKIYDGIDMTESQSVREVKIVAIKYGDAEEIAEVVKDVYRDLLSPNDKALQKNAQPQQQQERRFSFFETMDDDDETKVPRFKGLLSIGVDTKASQLVVSSPRFLLGDVLEMIGELDEAAKATLPVVQVIKVRPYVTGTMVREALADYAKGGTGTTPGAQQNQGDNEADKARAKAMRDGEKAKAAESDSE